MTTGIQSAIVELLIANVNYYFPDSELYTFFTVCDIKFSSDQLQYF